MNQYRRRFANLVVVAAVTALTVFVSNPLRAADAELVDQVNIPFTTFTLDNGLKVMVHTDHSVPTVFVGMWYLVGSGDEPQGKTGFAHLFEHLMFKDTENRKGDLFAPLTEAGATGMNGTTNPDRTNYYSTVPTEALDLALWLESDRMINLLGAVSQQALDDEREVVKNEKRQRYSRPYAPAIPRTLEGLYPVGHPYRHQTIGSMEDLNAASLEDVHEWFKTYYGASNAFLVLSGDVDLDTAKDKVQKYFGAAPTGGPLPKRQQWIPALESNKTEVMYDRAPQVVVSRNWPLPRADAKDTVLMDIVVDTFVGNENAPLRKRLVDELEWATDVSAFVGRGVVTSTLNLRVALKEDVDPDDVRAVIDQELAAYLDRGPDSSLLEASKLATTVETITGMESKSTIGFILAQGQLEAGDATFYKTALGWVNASTSEEVRTVARKWLTRPHYEITVLPFPDLSSHSQDADRSQMPPVMDGSSGVQFPEVQETTLKNGIKLVVAKHGDLPLVNAAFEIKTGSNADMDDRVGAASMVFDLLDDGAGRYSAEQFAGALNGIAMKPRTYVGPSSSSVSYRILTPYFDKSVALIADMLQRPAFSEEEVSKLKGEYVVALDGVEKNPSTSALDYFWRAIYGADAPISRMQTRQSLESVTRKDLVDFHFREITPSNITIYLIGNIELEAAKATLNRYFGRWRATGGSNWRPVGKAVGKKPRVILVNKPSAVQSTIYVGHALPEFDAENDTLIDAVNDAFGGSYVSRVNMNLREDKGWTYSMRSRLMKNADGDQSIIVGGSVQTDKTKESMMEVMREYREFVSTRPATAHELNRFSLSQTRGLPGRYSTSSAFLFSISKAGRYGVPYDYDVKVDDRVREIELGDVREKARELIDPDNLTWVVVGDLEKIEEDVRSLNYGEVEVWDAFGNPLR